jgi:hypothetical protein
LRVEEVLLVPEEVAAQPECYRQIDQVITRELDYQPGEFFWRQYVRPKFVRRQTPAAEARLDSAADPALRPATGGAASPSPAPDTELRPAAAAAPALNLAADTFLSPPTHTAYSAAAPTLKPQPPTLNQTSPAAPAASAPASATVTAARPVAESFLSPRADGASPAADTQLPSARQQRAVALARQLAQETVCDPPEVLIAALPNRLIEKGLPGVGLLVHLLLSRFEDHLPF